MYIFINMNAHTFLKKHYLFLTILIFLVLYGLIFKIKPSFLYRKDGLLRKFGLGYKNKTIIPKQIKTNITFKITFKKPNIKYLFITLFIIYLILSNAMLLISIK